MYFIDQQSGAIFEHWTFSYIYSIQREYGSCTSLTIYDYKMLCYEVHWTNIISVASEREYGHTVTSIDQQWGGYLLGPHWTFSRSIVRIWFKYSRIDQFIRFYLSSFPHILTPNLWRPGVRHLRIWLHVTSLYHASGAIFETLAPNVIISTSIQCRIWVHLLHSSAIRCLSLNIGHFHIYSIQR